MPILLRALEQLAVAHERHLVATQNCCHSNLWDLLSADFVLKPNRGKVLVPGGEIPSLSEDGFEIQCD